MNYNKRYIPVKCLKDGNNYIPFWLLSYVDSEEYGEGYYGPEGNKHNASFNELVECMWDVVDRKVILGVVKDVYNSSRIEFKLEEVVLNEVAGESSTYYLDKVVEIIYEEYDISVRKANDLDYEISYFTEEEIANMNPETLYEIRLWKPFYKLESGKIIKWSYQLKHLKEIAIK